MPTRSASRDSSRREPAPLPAQQPLQMFFNFAFINWSSALIVSTYFELSIFVTGARDAGLAATGEAGGGATLS
jgi:hypothetical protein